MDSHNVMALARRRATAHPSEEGCAKYLHVDKCPPVPELSFYGSIACPITGRPVRSMRRADGSSIRKQFQAVAAPPLTLVTTGTCRPLVEVPGRRNSPDTASGKFGWFRTNRESFPYADFNAASTLLALPKDLDQSITNLLALPDSVTRPLEALTKGVLQ